MGAARRSISQKLRALVGWSEPTVAAPTTPAVPSPRPEPRPLSVVPRLSYIDRRPIAPEDELTDEAIAHALSLATIDVAPGEDEEVERMAALVVEYIDQHPRQLTSFPSLAMRILELLGKEEVNTPELIGTITQDAAISAALLRVANSSFFSRGMPITGVTAAVNHIGLQHVGEIAVGIATRSLYRRSQGVAGPFDDLWQRLFHRSMTVAFASGALARLQRTGAERAFTGGLFHDIGSTVVLRALTDLVLDRFVDQVPERRVVERLIEMLHVPLGGQMAAEWELPPHIVEICRHYRDRDLSAERVDVHIVRLTSSLNALRVYPDVGSSLCVDARQSGQALHLDRKQFLALGQQVRDFAEKVTEVFHVTDD